MTDLIAQEIGEIHAVMRTDRRAYDRDPAMQTRLRILYETQDAAGGPQDAAQGDPVGLDNAAGEMVEITPLAAWLREGGDAADHAQRVAVAREVNDLLNGTDDVDRAALATGFEQLPVRVQQAAFAELISTRGVATFPVEAEDMAQMTKCPTWAEMAREWGGMAPEMLGRVRARLDRALESLSETDYDSAVAWIDAAPKSAMQAIARKLAR